MFNINDIAKNSNYFIFGMLIINYTFYQNLLFYPFYENATKICF